MRLYTLLVCFTLMVGACGTPDGLLAGGIKEETREKAAVAARFALEQVAAREARVGALSLVGVLKARRQVVAGNMWYLMIAAEDEQQQQLSFEAAVYESLPLGTANMKLTAYRQVIGDTEGMVPGEVHPVDEQREGVQAAAAFTAKEASGMSNSLAPWSVASVDDSRVQVGTSGLAYELKLTLARREEVQAVEARVERSVDGQLQILNLRYQPIGDLAQT